MVFGISNFDLIAGGSALIALVVAFAVLVALFLRHRTVAQTPRLHVVLGAPLNRPIPQRRPVEPPVLDDSPEKEPVIPGQPPEVAMVAGEPGRDSGDAVVDILSENQSPRDDADRVDIEDDLGDGMQVVFEVPHAQRGAGAVVGDALADKVGAVSAGSNSTFASAHSDVVEAQLMELRLALEASQAELTHLTASRDHAMTVVAESEQRIAQLRQEASERESQLAQQQEVLAAQVADIRQHSAALETELEQTRAQLETTAEQLATRRSTDAEHLAQTESQHTAIFELRQLLGQYEAIQASLQREKLDFATQVRDWQQKADCLEAELELVRQESAAEDPATPTGSDSTEASRQLNELQDAHQQTVADLSLANETVKQLNQQLMLRDAAFAQVEYEKQLLDRQLAEHIDSAEEPRDGSVMDVEVAQQRDQARAELTAAQAELQVAQHELALLQTVAADYGEGSPGHLQQLRAELESACQQAEQAREELASLLPLREAHETLQTDSDHQQSLITQLAEDCQSFQKTHQSDLQTIEELRGELARMTEESEAWRAERLMLLQRFQAAETAQTDELGSVRVVDVPPAGDEEDQAQLQRLQSILELRDRGFGELQKRFAELEENHRLTAAEANELRSKLSLSEKLREENAEYCESVARLQADANAWAELKLERDRDRAEFEEQLQQAQIAKEAAMEQLKQRTQRDVRIQDVAAKLGKAQDEVASLNSALQEHKALVRALRARQDTQGEPIENGQAAPRSVRKRETKPRDATRIRTDAQFREVDNQPPEQVDDLQQIHGIGPVLEKRLNEIGIYRFAQIKEWTKSAVEQLDEQLSLRGRIVRDRWVQQARKLSKS